jgi:predicted XRE-type DNA-binding protein
MIRSSSNRQRQKNWDVDGAGASLTLEEQRTLLLINALPLIPEDINLTPTFHKAPVRPGWRSENPLSRNQIKDLLQRGEWIEKENGRKYFQPYNGYAILTGNGLVVVDLDGRSAMAAARGLFDGNVPRTPSWKGSKGQSLLYRLPSELTDRLAALPTAIGKLQVKKGCVNGEQIELLYQGKSATIPPSWHPGTDNGYQWLLDFSQPIAEAPVWVREIFEAEIERKERFKNIPIASVEEGDVSTDLIQQLLDRIDSDDRDVWINVGYAVKGLVSDDMAGFDLWDGWSQKSSKYETGCTDKVWDGLTNPRVGLNYLKRLAGVPVCGQGFKPATQTEVEPDPREYQRVIEQQQESDRVDEAQHNQSLLDRVLSAFKTKKTRRPARARVERIASAVETQEITYTAGLLPDEGGEKFVWIVETEQQKEFVYEAVSKGYANLMNRSGTGSGKSHHAGLMEPSRLKFPQEKSSGDPEIDEHHEKRSPSIWYMSKRSRLPSTETVEANFEILTTRHQGLKPTGEKTPLKNEVLKPVIDPEQPSAGNCMFAHLFAMGSDKNYEGGKTEAKDNPICLKCPHSKPMEGEDKPKCANHEGEGFGYRYQRRSDMGTDRLSLNPQSAPAKMPKNVLAVWEEVAEQISPKVVKAKISDLNDEMVTIAYEVPDLDAKVKPILKKLRWEVGGGDGLNRWGVTSTDISKDPAVSECLNSLGESERALVLEQLQPLINLSLEDVLESESFDNHEEAQRVKSLEGKARTASKRAAKCLLKADEFKREAAILEKQIIGSQGFVPAVEWLKASSIAGDVRDQIKAYWAARRNQERSEAKYQELKAEAIAVTKEAELARSEYERLKAATRRAKSASEGESLKRLESAPVQTLWDCLNILFFPGEGYGEFRIANGELTLTLPDERIRQLVGDTAGNLYLDATKNPEILKVELGIQRLLQFKTADNQVNNVRQFQVSGFGKCGRDRAESTNQRLHALHRGIREKAIALLKTEDFHLEVCEYKTLRDEFGAKLGHLQNTRGSNAIAGSQVLIVHGLPKPNYGAVCDEYGTLIEPSFTIEQFWQQKCDDEIRQLCGRLRANLSPNKEFLIFWVTEEELPHPAEKLEAEQLSEDAANKTVRTLRALTSMVDDWWKEHGVFPTQKTIAEQMNVTQPWVSKLMAKLDGGMKMLKQVVAGLISPPRILDEIPSEDEQFVAESMMPAIAESSPEEVASEINVIVKTFGWSGWSRILRATGKRVRLAVLDALLKDGGMRQKEAIA